MDNYRHPKYNRYNRNEGQYQNPSCGCGVSPVVDGLAGDRYDKDYMDKCIDKLPLAMAYVPFQKWRKVYDAPNGLANGTIFEELKLPWLGYKDYCLKMRGDRS